MRVRIPYGRTSISAEVGGDAEVVTSQPTTPQVDVARAVVAGLERPIEADPLAVLLHRKGAGRVCVAVGSVWRGLPGEAVLGPLLDRIQAAGVHPGRILLLIATGLHRPTTEEEKRQLLGPVIAARFQVVDHDANDPSSLAKLPIKSPAGAEIRLNRLFLEADLKIVVGLIQPHPILGYTGGPETVCPGLVDLGTVRHLYGAAFLGRPETRAGLIEGNPSWSEALAVARAAGVDLSLDVTLDADGRVVGVYAGDVEAAHRLGVRELEGRLHLEVLRPADLVITSGGGFPGDGDFRAVAESAAAVADLVRPGGIIICCAACQKDITSRRLHQLLSRCRGDYRRFLKGLPRRRMESGQWHLQLLARALEKVRDGGLYCVTEGIETEVLTSLSLSPPRGRGREMLQETVAAALDKLEGEPHVVVVPEGPRVVPYLAA